MRDAPSATATVGYTPRVKRAFWWWAVVSVAALGLRVVLLWVSPRWGFPADHDQFVRWAIQATDYGVLTVYDRPPPRWNIRDWWAAQRAWVIIQRPFDERCNYPPLSVYLLYLTGLVFKWVSPDRLINTPLSHGVFSSWSIAADFLLAVGCAALVRRYRPGRAPFWTFAAVLFAPPIWWDTAVWGQVDSSLLAAAVWMLWAILEHRWAAAGLLFGVAAGLKPQAVLFLPLWGMVIVTARPVWKPVLALLLGAAVTAAAALPFFWQSGLAWWRASYVENIVPEDSFTTLAAFNLWYVDLLRCGSVDATVRWLGVTKAAWGKVLLGAALLAGFAWLWRRWRGDPRGYVVWALLSLLACALLPTGVHERYVVLFLPFLLVAAAWYPRLRRVAVLWMFVMMCQLTWPHWIKTAPNQWEDRARREVIRQYQARRATLSPAQRQTAPSLDEFLRRAHQEFLRGRARSVWFEQVVLAAALFGAVVTVAQVVALKPERGQSHRSAGARPRPA